MTPPSPEQRSGVQMVGAGYGKGWPRVAGACPACGRKALFVGSGGYVTCATPTCPDPGMVADVLDGKPGAFDAMRVTMQERCS